MKSHPFDLQTNSLSALNTTTPVTSIYHKILKPCDPIMNYVAEWSGVKARFVLRKKGSVSIENPEIYLFFLEKKGNHLYIFFQHE